MRPPLPTSFRLARIFVYFVLALTTAEVATHLGFWATLILLASIALSGMFHYLLGWNSRERMIEERDPGLEELRGRSPDDVIFEEERERGLIPEPGEESEDAWP